MRGDARSSYARIAVADHRAAAATRCVKTQGWSAACSSVPGVDRHPVRAAHGDTVGDAADRDGVRFQRDLLAAASRLAGGERVGTANCCAGYGTQTASIGAALALPASLPAPPNRAPQRPTRRRGQPETRPPPMGDRAQLRMVQQVQATHHPLQTKARHPPRLHLTRLLTHMPARTGRTVVKRRSQAACSPSRNPSTWARSVPACPAMLRTEPAIRPDT